MHIPNQIHAFNYLGSKFSVLPWLLPLLKHTKSWVDVFGGTAGVTINRKPSPIETYNDINESLTNFFRQLRDHPQELIDLLYLTPHSRLEYENAWDTVLDSELERARKFFVRIKQSFLSTGSQKELKGWVSATKESRCKISEATSKWINGIDGLPLIIERMRTVQIECRPYDWIFNSYDTPETMFYCDPPYDKEFRSSSSDYMFDFTQDDHVKLYNCAKAAAGYVAVSGYNSDFMMDLYKGFHFTKGPIRKNNYSINREVRECLWTNYDPYNCNGHNLLFS